MILCKCHKTLIVKHLEDKLKIVLVLTENARADSFVR